MSLEREQWSEARRQAFKEALTTAGINAFVFDLDDTLKRTYFTEGRLIYLEYLAKLSGQEIDQEQFISAWTAEFVRLRQIHGTNPKIHVQISQQMASKYGLVWESAEVVEAFNEMWQQIYGVVPEAMPGAEELVLFLNQLDQGTYVVTHGEEEWTKLKLSDWPDYFNDIHCVDVNGPKDAMAWSCGLQQFGLKPSEIVVIGDNPQADIESCRQLGVQHLFLINGRYSPKIDQLPGVTQVSDLRQIIDHLENSLTSSK